jgi:hypothetical protein
VQGGNPFEQHLTVSNTGGGTLLFTASIPVTGAGWLSIHSTSGSATSAAAGTVSYSIDPSNLTPGVYFGSIAVSSANPLQTTTVPITLTVSAQPQSILVSQTGFQFTGIAQGPSIPSRVFSVLNVGEGSMSWAASASTLSGGPGWLTISPQKRHIQFGFQRFTTHYNFGGSEQKFS